MSRKNYLVILSSLTLICSPAFADSPADRVKCTPDKPNHCVVDIEIGQIAPISGQLMSNPMAMSLGLKLELETRKLSLEIEKLKKLHGIELKKEKNLRISNTKFCEEQKNILKKQIERPWFEHPVFVALATATAVLATVYVAGHLK